MKNCENCGTLFEEPKYCSEKCEQESNMKYTEIPKEILPRVKQHTARTEFECENKCGYIIQKSGNYWRVTNEKGANPMCVCFKCKEAKGM